MHRWPITWNAPARWLLVFVALTLVGVGTLASSPLAVSAAIAPTVLGTAQSFAVLGGSTVTNTGPTVINGASVGVSPGSAITGFPPGIVTAPGTIHAADAVAAQAQADALAAYNTLASQPCGTNLPTELGGLTLTPGVYCLATAGITGTLTLDAQGNPNAVFVFKVASTLITASNSKVLLINGASPCNVYWQVGSSATLGTNTTFVGNILALTSISVTTGATVAGRALALNGAVTLDTNRFTPSACSTTPINTPTNTPTPPSTPTNTPVATPTNTPTPPSTPTSTPTDTPPQPPAGPPPVVQPPAVLPPVVQPVAPLPVVAQPIPPQPVPAQPVAAQTVVSQPVAAKPVAVQPVAIRPVAAQPAVRTNTGSVVFPAPDGQGATGSAPASAGTSNAAMVSGSIVTGTTDTTAPISATLSPVGTPANAAATAPPIPVAMGNTGGGGMATQFTTPAGGVNSSNTRRLPWLSVLVMLIALASAGLLFVRRPRR